MTLSRHDDTTMTPTVVAMTAWMEDTSLRKKTQKDSERKLYKVIQAIGGQLIHCSCEYHVEIEMFIAMVTMATWRRRASVMAKMVNPTPAKREHVSIACLSRLARCSELPPSTASEFISQVKPDERGSRFGETRPLR